MSTDQRSRVVIIGAGYPISTASIIERLTGYYEPIEIWPVEDLYRRHPGPYGHLHELSKALLQKAIQQKELEHARDYWYNFIEMRDREVERSMHRPPKKTTCTTRRRGRKCKK